MGAVYGPYEINKKRIGNKSMKFTKRAIVFDRQRKSEKCRGKITPFSIFNFKEYLYIIGWFCVCSSIPDIQTPTSI